MLPFACSPAEAEPDAAPVENFPYPAEYAAPPASTPTQPPPSPAAAAELVEQEVENFPYPAQYAFHAEDGSHTHADDGSELPLEQSEEEEQLVDSGEEDEGEPHWAGVSPPRDDEDDAGDEEQQQQDAAAAPSPSPAAPAAVTSATFTLEGESTGSSSISSESAAAGSWWRQARRSVRDALSAVQPVGHEMLELYAAGWSALWDMLFPSPPTPAEGEAAERARERKRSSSRNASRGGEGQRRHTLSRSGRSSLTRCPLLFPCCCRLCQPLRRPERRPVWPRRRWTALSARWTS